jgi:hypothetical protein
MKMDDYRDEMLELQQQRADEEYALKLLCGDQNLFLVILQWIEF